MLELGHGLRMGFALALLADDFAYYWFHRLHHEVRVLWAAHVTHHSSQRYNLATALRQSWIADDHAALLRAARRCSASTRCCS